jgi:tetratricopeptide (TPR) repeat protein
MIVKNEEKNLAACLGPVVSLFDEIIVVDTGSTDQTKTSARRFGAKVFDFAWVDSFAAARNESLQHATGEWIFWLDADERIDEANRQKLHRLLSELPKENHAYMMCQQSTADPLTGAVLVVDQVRLFRKLPGVFWRYRCHEQIFMTLKEQGAREVPTDIVIGHLGYEEPTLHRRKRQRNLRLLQQELEQNPRAPFVLFNLANATIEEGRVAESLRHLHACLENAPGGASYLPKAYRLLAGGYHVLGRNDEALRVCLEGKKQFPHSTALWFEEGILLLARGDWAGARHCFETILRLPAQPNHSGADATLPGCRTRHNLGFVYKQLGLVRQAEEHWQRVTGESPDFEPTWLALLELYLEQDRQSEAEGLLLRLKGKPYGRTIQPALEARLALARGDLARAQRTLEDALLRAPNALWLRNLLADILLRVAGDGAGAEKHLRAILALSPNDVQTRRKLADLMSRR